MLLSHVVQQWLGRLDNIWVKQDLIDDGLDLGMFEEFLQLINTEADPSVLV